MLRGFGPALPRPKTGDALRSALGAGLGLFLAGLLLWLLTPQAKALLAHPLLIAPFGATAFLIFGVPNSPLAQPWSAVVGNTISALMALAVLALHLPPLLSGALAVALAMAAMALLRAYHPPGGAVALFTALAGPLPLTFALSPAFTGTVALVAFGLLWNPLTGRMYPFRQPPASPHGTADAAPERRHLPPPGAMAELLSKLRLGSIIGVEDLTRLITAAEAEAAARPLAGLTARHLMSRDLVTVTQDAPLPHLAAEFRTHKFKSLPVINHGRYVGLVNESALTGLANPSLIAADLISPEVETATPETPAAHLVTLLSDGHQQSVPVIENDHLIGLVTRSDLIALLARALPEQPAVG